MSEKSFLKKLKKVPAKWWITGGAIIVIVVLAAAIVPKFMGREKPVDGYETRKAEMRSVSRTVEGSSVIEANDTYNVTALVTGEILTDTFNEGDVVKKDTVLYTIDSSDAKSKVTQAENSLEKSRTNLETAQKNYNNLTVVSDRTGTVTEMLVKAGDSVADGTKIAKVDNTSKLKIQIPFNEADAGSIKKGDTAKLTMATSYDTLYGTVTNVASSTSTTPAHSIVRYVTITVNNPGALTAGEKASAVINNVACSDLGTFEYSESGYITAESNGEITSLYIDTNDFVSQGATVGYITSDNVRINLDNAKLDVENAEINLDEARDVLDNYTIKAPIDGTIITKNKKAGEKLEQGSSSAEPMAIIYDMSVLKVNLTIDESEIHDIHVGQAVTITGDAVEETFRGEVTKVGIDGTSQNGVTTYPVEVTIKEYGNLLPGMNVDCVIEVEATEEVVAIPVSAIQRGNTVYVEGEKTNEQDKAPDGFRTVSVETGITDGTYIEIKSGIKEGDTIITSVAPTGNEAVGAEEEAMQGFGPMGGGMPSGGMGPMGGGSMPSGGGMPR